VGAKEDEANEQHKSINMARQTAAPEWTFEQIILVTGRCHGGAVGEDDFYNKLERLSVQVGKKDKILVAHAQRICEAHYTVIRSYYQQVHGSSRADVMPSMENLGERFLFTGKRFPVNNSHQLLKKGEDGAKLE